MEKKSNITFECILYMQYTLDGNEDEPSPVWALAKFLIAHLMDDKNLYCVLNLYGHSNVIQRYTATYHGRRAPPFYSSSRFRQTRH